MGASALLLPEVRDSEGLACCAPTHLPACIALDFSEINVASVVQALQQDLRQTLWPHPVSFVCPLFWLSISAYFESFYFHAARATNDLSPAPATAANNHPTVGHCDGEGRSSCAVW
jgi:hypothetical protein